MAARHTKSKNNGNAAAEPADNKTAVKSANGSVLNGSHKPKGSSEMSESDKLMMRAWKRTYANRDKRVG